MRDLSLRFPYLIYLSIGSIFVGVLLAPLFREMPEDSAAPLMPVEMSEHVHEMLPIPSEGAPTLEMRVEQDPVSGWNITLATENFTFTPALSGQDHVPNTGHAHLYIDGVKVARLYGPHYHINDLAPGQHEIRVALGSNDHAYFMVDGQHIEARAAIMQGEVALSGS